MDLAALIAAVTEDTGRPEASKAGLISRAVSYTVLRAHQTDFYPRDRVFDGNVVPVSPSTAVIQALPTRWRKFDQIEIVDLSTGVSLGKKLSLQTPDDTEYFDGTELPNYYWVAGDNVHMFSTTTIQRVAWWWYQNPDLSTTSKSTWITNQWPQTIIDGAVAYVHAKLGDKSMSDTYIQLFQDALRTIRAEALLSEL